MSSDPFQRQREAARREDCLVPGIPGVFKAPPARAAENCETATPPPPEVFVTPERPAPADDAPLPVLLPLVVQSRSVTVRCSDFPELGAVGLPITLQPGAARENVYLPLLELTPSQYRYLASLGDADFGTLASPDTAVADLLQVGKLSQSQAQQLHDLIAAAQERADANAQLQARALLDCSFGNAQVQEGCAAGALTTAEGQTLGVPARNPVIVPAGTVLSKVSTADATLQAQAQARASRTCVWGNDAVTVTCQDAGFPDPVVTDPADDVVTPYGRRVGSVTVPANAFFSTASKADANAQAAQQARSGLNCIYLSAEAVLTCASIDAELFAGVQLLNPEEPADVSLGETGNPVRVPEGFVTSTTSQADADSQARAAATSALRCQWGNTAVTRNCETQTVGDVEISPSDKSPRPTVTVPAGAITSLISQEDADFLADLQAKFELQCLYCNPEIPPRCVPEYVLENPQDYPLPIPQEMVGDDWSADATPGIPAGTVCGQFATDVVTVADQIARVPFPSNLTKCRYLNDELKVACHSDVAAGVVGKFEDPSVLSQLSSLSVPNPHATNESQRYLVISAGTAQVYAAEMGDIPIEFRLPSGDVAASAKAYANALALRSGAAALDCFFESDAYTFTCQERLSLTDAQAAQLSANAIGSVVLPLGAVRSTTSKAEANALRDAQGNSSLFCLFESPALQVRCFDNVNLNPNALPSLVATQEDGTRIYGDGTALTLSGEAGGEVSTLAKGAPGNPVVVTAGAYVSYRSPEEALARALSDARASLDCYWTNPQLEIRCGASPTQAHPDRTSYPIAAVPAYASLDASAVGGATTPVNVQAHLERSYQGRTDAIRLAIIRGSYSLNCFWTNNAVTLQCPAPVPGTELVPGVPASTTVPARLLPSYVSKADANSQAQILAQASLFCLYQNPEYPPETPVCEGMSVPRPGLARGAVRLTDSAAVKATSDAIFAAGGGCVDDTTGLLNMLNNAGFSPDPGPPGVGGNCSGQCHAFYR